MITIECKGMRELMVELAAYLSEHTAAVGVIKNESVVLDPLTDEALHIGDIMNNVKAFLSSKDLSGDFIIKAAGEKITVISISGRKVTAEKTDLGLLICPHCGKVTLYEEEMNVHIKAHYFGF